MATLNKALLAVAAVFWVGLKMRLTLKDLLNTDRTRVRTIFVGERGSSAVSRRELIDNTRGRQLDLILSGSF